MQRRQFMQGAAALGTLGAVSAAGCTELSDLNPLASSDLDAALEWLPDPDWIDPELEHGDVEIRQPAEIADLYEFPGFPGTTSIEVAEVTPDDVDQEIEFSASNYNINIDIVLGDFDADWIDDLFFEDDDYDFETDSDGFEIHVDDSDEPSSAYAIRDDAYIEAESGTFGIDVDPDEVIEAVIDASNGDADRFVESVDAAETLADSLELAHETMFETFDRIEESNPEFGQFTNLTGYGEYNTIEDDYEDVTEIFVFRDDDDASDADTDEYIESGAFSDAVSEPETDVDDNIITIEYQRGI